MNAAAEQLNGSKTAVRPFRVNVPEADLTDLRRRIQATRLPEKEPVADMCRVFRSRRSRSSHAIGPTSTTGAS